MTVSYPFDPTGLADSNIVPDEIHTLTEVNAQSYRILIPTFAPFYLGNFTITHTDSSGQTRPLIEDVDYTFCLPYIGATRSIGQMVYGGVSINDLIVNGVLKVTYRTLGGDWIADTNYVLNMLAEHVYNPRITVWDVVTNKSTMFPPINHDQTMDYVYGHQDLINSLNSVADSIIGGPDQGTPAIHHLLDENNPHHVTKAQVGLADVVNYPQASDEEVDSLTPVDKYFTLRQLLLLGIIGVDAGLLATHIGDHTNPHNVTKAQVGLSDVVNLPLATPEDILGHFPVDKYITLAQVLEVVANMAPVVLQGSDISRAELLYYSASPSRKL